MSSIWMCGKRVFKDSWIRKLDAVVNMQISDGSIPGLYLRYYKTTGAVSFFLQCKVVATGKRKNIFLGKLSEFESVDQVVQRARQWREKALSQSFAEMRVNSENLNQELLEGGLRKRFDETFMVYMDKYAALYKKPSTQHSNFMQYKLYIKPIFGDRYIESLQEKDVLDAYSNWVRKTSFSTANKVLSLVSSFWDWCESYGYLPRRSNPCCYVKKGTNAKYEPTVLSLDGYKKLFRVLDIGAANSKMHPRLFRAIKVLALTGCRASEITDLEIDEVSFPDKMLRLKDSKTGARKVKLADAAVKELELAVEEAKLLDSKYVFPGIKDKDKPVDNIRKPFEWALKEAGLPHMRIHDLRHSFITMGANLGENMNAMKDAAGHSRLTTTEHYTHYADEQTFKAVNHITEAICA